MKKIIYGAAVMAALLMGTTAATATVVETLGGGPVNNVSVYSGYSDGNTASQSQFNTPCGIAVDSTGTILLVADRGNNAIRIVDASPTGNTETFAATDPSLINQPIGVAIDSENNIFVLNYGNGSNGSVYEFDGDFGDTIATNAVNLANVGGIALDSSDNLYVTVNKNQLIRITTTNTTIVATIPTAGTSLQGLVVKRGGATAGLIAVCDSGNNGIYLINPTNGVVTSYAGFHGAGDFPDLVAPTDQSSSSQAKFNQPMGLAEASDGSLIVADYGNNRVKVVKASNGGVNNLYGVLSSLWVGPLNPSDGIYPGWFDGTVIIPDVSGDVEARQPFGLVLAPDGTLYVTENYYDIIRMVTATGLLPPPPPPAVPTGLAATVTFGQVNLTWAASSSATSYNIKRSLTIGGPYTTIANVSGTSYTDTGLLNGTTYYYVVSGVGPGGESANSDELIVILPTLAAPTSLAATTNFGQVNLTWAASSGAASYNVKRSTSSGGPYTTIANRTITSYTDSNVLGGTVYFYVVSAVNAGGESTNSLEISATPPIPPPAAPTIGWYDYEGNVNTGFFSVLHPVGVATFNNDQLIAINPNTNGVATYYIAGSKPLSGVPAATNGTAPPFYQDGILFPGITPLSVPTTTNGDLIIKAVNVGSGGSSPVTTAEFLFQVGGPTIIGNNAANFKVSDVTSNVTFYYTTDGSTPTNDGSGTAINAGTNNPVTIFLNASTTNVTFTVRAFRNGYSPSSPATQVFSSSGFVADNTISFGFASGEASSVFVASPGQTFYAPVTLTSLSSSNIYSMQFEVTVTNVSPAIPAPGPFGFTSMLLKPDPSHPGIFLQIPPLMFINTNSPQVTNTVFYDGSTNFVSLLITNLSENLLGVGWLERIGKTNLYDTTAQDLIQFSQAHDTLFQQSGGKIIIGGYSFQVPVTALPGQTNYQIQIEQPSATSDGVGGPGSAVFIYAPTNGSFVGGTINSIKYVTMGQIKYIAGDVYPFGWFNAGDFGKTNLENADVQQVFNAAVYGLNSPSFQAPGSDFFDAMDSCGQLGVPDPTTGFLMKAGALTPAQQSSVFGGDYTTMDQMVFGDGTLDVADVYVTFVRSIDPQRTWYRRFWTNGVLEAEVFDRTNAVSLNSLSKTLTLADPGPVSVTNAPLVNFASTDFVASAGQVLQIPVTARVFGFYPLRVAMLNISVVPLDGSPELTVPVSFTLNAPFNNAANYNPGAAGLEGSSGNGNYSIALLPVQFPIPQSLGISNSAVIGTLTVTIPTNATSLSSYAVHFDHASGSPNGIASFSRHTLTGLITLSSRTNSTYNDGIPDSWRLRWFGTVNNFLSVSNADADGDGFNNWQEYVAGTDPTDSKSHLLVGTDQPMAQSQQDSVVYWPSTAGKQYVIQRSASLFPGTWNSISTNNGTGGNMEIHDASGGSARFYRVSVH